MDTSTIPMIADVQPSAAVVQQPVKDQSKGQGGKTKKSAGGFAGVFSEAVSAKDQLSDNQQKPGEVSQQFNLFGLLPLLAVTPQAGSTTIPQAGVTTGDTKTGITAAAEVIGVTAGGLGLIKQASLPAEPATVMPDTVKSLIDAALPQMAVKSTGKVDTNNEVNNILSNAAGQSPETVQAAPSAQVIPAKVIAQVTDAVVKSEDNRPLSKVPVTNVSAKTDDAVTGTGSATTNKPLITQSIVQAALSQSELNSDKTATAPSSDVANKAVIPDTNATPVQQVAAKETADNLPQFSLDVGKNAEFGKDQAAQNNVDQTTLSFAATLSHQVTSTQPHATIASSAAPQSPVSDPNNVLGQIIDNARLINKAQSSEMVIKLKPEHLGELTLKIAVDNGGVTATFHSSNADVRGVIEASLPQLKQDMANQGLKVNYVGVYTSLDQSTANDQQRNFAQQQAKSAKSNRKVDFIEATEEATAMATQMAADGVDYRI